MSLEIKQEDALDEALLDSEGMLRESLQKDETARKKRRFRTVVTFVLLGLVTISGLVLYTRENAVAQAPEALVSAGWRLWHERRYMAAEVLFEKAVEEDPKNEAGWNGLGWSRLNAGKHAESVEPFQKAIELNPKAWGSLNGIGQASYAMGKYDDAIKQLEVAEPGATAAHPVLLRLYLSREMDEKAKAIAEKIEDDPNYDKLDSQTHAMVDAAISGEVTDAMRKLPGRGAVTDLGKKNGQAWQLFYSGANAKAEKLFREILDEDPEMGAAINGLAFSLLNQGKKSEAEPLFDKLLKENPDHGGALNGKARCVYDSDPDEAVKIWEKMSENYKQATAATAALASHYYKKEDFAKAIPHLKLMAQSKQPGTGRYAEMLEKAEAAVKD